MICLGSMVHVINSEGLTAEGLGIDEDDFSDFLIKVAAGETAIVFDFDDENLALVDIVFEDGLELFFVPILMLELEEDEENA
jgi:hypothetical protein